MVDELVRKEEFYYPSADGITQIHAIKWVPSEKVIGIVQIAHGMAEHIERYDEFARFLAAKKFLVCANDHLGHGKSVISQDRLGFFAEENGWEKVVEDMYTLTCKIKEDYPDKPYILMGHSMGSFMSRYYAAKYGEGLTGLILTGTGSGTPFINFVIKYVQKKMNENGKLTVANDIDKKVFGKYNKKAYPRHSDYDWLSRDADEVDKYINDPLCGFVFTYGGFFDLFSLIKEVSGKKWAEQVPQDLDIYFFSGDMDPVGNYSHGVVKVVDWLTATGHRRIYSKFYEGGRHEMLNESNRVSVKRDVLKWLNNHIDEIKEREKRAREEALEKRKAKK